MDKVVKGMNGTEYKEKEYLLSLYKSMKRIRMVEDAIALAYPQRDMHTPIHLYTGQEAIASGVCANLTEEDYVVSNHRCHGHYLAKGGNLNKLIAELHNKASGCSKGYGGSMHLLDNDVKFTLSSSIVAGGVPIGTGLALASYIKEDEHVTVIFLGDAASEEGCVYESICFAKLLKLPVIFVCENNLYSIATSLDKREPTINIADKFSGILPTYVVDGNNVLEVYEKTSKVVKQAREGEGPSFLECKTYRLKDHHNVNTGVEQGYRTQEEWDMWNEKSPITFLENKLLQAGLMNSKMIKELEKSIEAEILIAFEYARKASVPVESDLLKNVYYGE